MATVTEAQQFRWRLRIKWRTLWIMLLVVGWGTVIVGIAGAYLFKWHWLRYLTSELNIRIDALAGMHEIRVSNDTVTKQKR